MSYYQVYLDESGSFQENEWCMIGGFIWKDEHPTSELSSIMREVCLKVCTNISNYNQQHQGKYRLSYPKCIHTTEMHISAIRDLMKRKVKEEIKDMDNFLTVAVFTEYDAARSGQEHHKDMLYAHMMETLIRNLILKIRNEDCDAHICIYIPTREVTVSINDIEAWNSLRQSGYIKIAEKDGYIHAKANDPAQFRWISDELLCSYSVGQIYYPEIKVCDRIQIVEAVEEAQKKVNGSLWCYYVADMVVDIIKTFPRNELSYIELRNKMGIIDNRESYFVIPYSEEWKKSTYAASHSIENPLQYLETLKYINSKINIDKYPYFDACKKYLLSNNPFSVDARILHALQEICNQYRNFNRYAEEKELLEILIKLSHNQEHSIAYCNVLIELMSCYHHVGNNREATKLFNLASSYFGNKYPLQRINLIIKYYEVYVDSLGFEQGIRHLRDTLSFIENNISDDSIRLGPGSHSSQQTKEDLVVKAKVLSSLGAQLSYIGECREAEEYFREAINLFESVGHTIDVSITRCYLIHMLLDRENPIDDKLVVELNIYFKPNGGSAPETIEDMMEIETWNNWLQGIISQYTVDNTFKVENARFSLWIFLKTLCGAIENGCCLIEKKELWEERILKNYETIYTKMLKTKEHPIEMLLKYYAKATYLLSGNVNTTSIAKQLDEIISYYRNKGMIPFLCRIAKKQIDEFSAKKMTQNSLDNLLMEVRNDLMVFKDDLDEVEDYRIMCTVDELLNDQNFSFANVEKRLRYEFR